jgi:hypothetical protein
MRLLSLRPLSNNGMHPTAHPTALIFGNRSGAAGDAGRYVASSSGGCEMQKVFVLSLALAVAVAQQTYSQSPQDTAPALTEEQKAKVGALIGVSSRPVVYGKGDDGLPRRIRLRGVITEVSFVPVYCGVMCFSGTAKLKVLKADGKYGHDYAYVAILCFIGKEEDFLNKVVDVDATKLQKSKPHGCDGIVNTIDSGGVPFYRVKRWSMDGGHKS